MTIWRTLQEQNLAPSKGPLEMKDQLPSKTSMLAKDLHRPQASLISQSNSINTLNKGRGKGRLPQRCLKRNSDTNPSTLGQRH